MGLKRGSVQITKTKITLVILYRSSWGPELKYCRYDGWLFSGKSDKPLYLYIQDSTIELKEMQIISGARENRETWKC